MGGSPTSKALKAKVDGGEVGAHRFGQLSPFVMGHGALGLLSTSAQNCRRVHCLAGPFRRRSRGAGRQRRLRCRSHESPVESDGPLLLRPSQGKAQRQCPAAEVQTRQRERAALPLCVTALRDLSYVCLLCGALRCCVRPRRPGQACAAAWRWCTCAPRTAHRQQTLLLSPTRRAPSQRGVVWGPACFFLAC